MFLNNNKRKIAIFVLFFFMFSFPIKLKESYANPVALEVVLWGVAAVLTAAGIMVDTGDTESLLYAAQEYYDNLKAPEKAMYERMAMEASERGNAELTDYLWSRANNYVKSKYIDGSNTVSVDPRYGTYQTIYNNTGLLINNHEIAVTISNTLRVKVYVDGVIIHDRDYGWDYVGPFHLELRDNDNILDIFAKVSYIGIREGRFGYYNTALVSVTLPSNIFNSQGNDISSYYSPELNINFMSISPEEFQFSTPVPPGAVPERRIAYPSHVFNPNNDIDGILEPLTGKTAQDIWGAAGAYSANTTTFDPVSGDNPILPWVPIADPSTFTPAGEFPAEISATAPGVLDGTNSDLNSISGSLGSIWDILKTGFNALIDTIWTGISHLLDGLGSISLLLKSVFDLINSGISAIVGAISSIWDLVYDGFASVAAALRGILDQVANVVGYLNPASDTFFLRTALVPDVAVLNGFVESLNINFQEKFQIAAAYEEFQSYKDTDHESEFEDIYVDLPIWGMQCICKGEFVNTAGQQFKSVVAAFLIMLTVIFCFKRIATIGSK